MASKKEKPDVNFVHQNAILCETIKKEQQNQKLYTNYSVNPFTKSKYYSSTYCICIKQSADGKIKNTRSLLFASTHSSLRKSIF